MIKNQPVKIFFEIFLKKIWSVQKKVVSLYQKIEQISNHLKIQRYGNQESKFQKRTPQQLCKFY